MTRPLDLLIRGGTVIDGTGSPAFGGDVGIRDGLIVSLGEGTPSDATATLDAQGLVVCPGFVDAHAHDDLAILHDPTHLPKLLQGVTTTVVGNCGQGIAPVDDSPALREALRTYTEPVLGAWPQAGTPFGYETVSDYIQAIREARHSLNVSTFVGHGPLRIQAMGFSSDIASAKQLERMQNSLVDGMQAGALGLSLGLMYAPGCFADAREFVELAKVVHEYGGLVTSHIRGEGDLLIPSIQEMLDIARVTGVSMHISHLKSVGLSNWGKVHEALSLIRQARTEGLDVTCDVYPYAAGSTTILSLLPPWALQGGLDAVLERLEDAAQYQRIREELLRPSVGWDNVAYLTGFDRAVLSSAQVDRLTGLVGKSFSEIATEWNETPVDAYLHAIQIGGGRDTIVIHHMSEDDMRAVLKFEASIIGSDGLPTLTGHPHPRLYGTFARYLGQYVRDEGLLSMEEAIGKVTKQPAIRFGLKGRGVLLPTAFADLVVLDWPSLQDLATYEHPRVSPLGVRHVIVNGQVAVRDGQPTASESGTFIAREPA